MERSAFEGRESFHEELHKGSYIFGAFLRRSNGITLSAVGKSDVNLSPVINEVGVSP